ncbi:MAG TPA: type IX secretion system outer membrane channel protein PorV, partial [Chitinophagales bacterium]
MNFKNKISTLLLVATIMLSGYANAQNSNAPQVNTITTAVPFLTIATDTRAGGMGDVGIATSPDAGGAQLNGAKMAFVENDFGVSMSFTPWLKALVGDIYLANISGYYKIKGVQTVHAGIRYFSMGQIQFTDDQGNNTAQSRPQELAVDAGYARKFGIVSVDVTLRFIYSNIAGTVTNGSTSMTPGIAGAGDISFFLNKKWDGKGKEDSHELYAGMNLSNLGSKIAYSSNVTKDFIPANMGIGLGYKYNINKLHSVGAYMDINKLLVPTPIPSQNLYNTPGQPGSGIKSQYDTNNDGIADFRAMSSVAGIFNSFNPSSAPGGVKEKLEEINFGIGAEYWYKKMFGVRTGYFYENPYK